MDLLTHVLLAYLVSFGLWGPNGLPYIAAGALAGGLPDADVLLFPLARRFPLVRHHGITHSLLGVTVTATAGAFIVPRLFSAVLGPSFSGGSTVLYFLAMETGGVSHILLDGFTHFSVPPLAPFSRWELHLDADRAINLGILVFTGFSFWLLLYERGRVPLSLWESTAWVLLGLYSAYLLLRLLGRWRAELVKRVEGYRAVIPQGNPLHYFLFNEEEGEEGLSLRMARFHVLRGLLGTPRVLEIPKEARISGPVRSSAEAIAQSYGEALRHGRVLEMTHHFAEVEEAPGGFNVFWYSLEFTMLGRAAGVAANVDSVTGKVRVKRVWKVPKSLASH